jgi:hypothetical protein
MVERVNIRLLMFDFVCTSTLSTVDIGAVAVTTLGGAISATLGVLVGGVVTRRVQERHWLRDKQLQAYQELFSQYARLMMALRQAHLDRRALHYDWAPWSVALTSAGLIAPRPVATAIDEFGAGVGVFLAEIGPRNSVTDPADEDELTAASRAAAAAHLTLLNAIRKSMGRSLGPLPFYIGGTLGGHPEGTGQP